MRSACLAAWLLLPASVIAAQLVPKDEPARGEWPFNPVKIWEIDRAGNDEFGRIGELLVSDKEHVWVRDFGRNVSYLFDGNGTFIRALAPRGEGAGQLPFYLNRFRAGNRVVLAAPDKLHYFSDDGVFERAVANDLFVRFPLWFVSDSEFIYAPNLPQSPVHDTKLIAVNLDSGEERSLLDFSEPGARNARSLGGPMLMIPSLTPQVKVLRDRGRMIFGRNDRYKIFVADRAGRIHSTFSLDRRRTVVTLQVKQDLLRGVKISDAQKDQVVAQLPDETTCFSQLYVVDGNIYVFAVTDPQPKTRSQQVDIFSDNGTYLYRSTLQFGEGLAFAGASDLVLAGRHAYVILEDGRGRRTLAKYRITLPR